MSTPSGVIESMDTAPFHPVSSERVRLVDEFEEQIERALQADPKLHQLSVPSTSLSDQTADDLTDIGYVVTPGSEGMTVVRWAT